MDNNTNVRIVGSKDNPINIYWDAKNRKIDEYLLLLSITSGAYGLEHVDKSTFFKASELFLRYARNKDSYCGQIQFVLDNCDSEIAHKFSALLLEKWQLVFCYSNIYEKSYEA